MRLLLDTCTFLWIIGRPDRLSQRAKSLFRDPKNATFLSAVSMWEIGVKNRLGKLPLPGEPAVFLPTMRRAHHIAALDLDEAAALEVSDLPLLHNDPFDRMLICQARRLDLTILSPDAAIRSYDVKTDW